VLVKRVEALLRSAGGGPQSSEKTISELIFNDEAHEVRLEGKEIDLTLKEYKILKKFLESPGRVFSREQLLELAEQGAMFIPGLNEEDAPADETAEGAEGEAAPRKACKVCAPVDEVLQLLTGRGATKFVNRAMLVSLIASLAALPLGNRAVHTAAGGVFVGGVLQHLIAHRKSL
jgi:hypothetical protein